MKNKLLALGFMFVFMAAGPVFAQTEAEIQNQIDQVNKINQAGQNWDEKPISPLDELSKANSAYVKGDYLATLEALWAAQEGIWKQAPLGVRNVAFVNAPPENFGTYVPKEGEDFQTGESLIIYCEPIGFTQVKENGTYKYSLVGAFDIINDKGQIIGGQKNIGPYEQSGYRTFSTEVMMVMTLNLRGLLPGQYTMRITLTDNFDTTKSVEIEKPFNIVN